MQDIMFLRKKSQKTEYLALKSYIFTFRQADSMAIMTQNPAFLKPEIRFDQMMNVENDVQVDIMPRSMVICVEKLKMTESLSGIFDDNGNKINPDLIAKPSLCVSCRKDGISGEEEILCALTRADQQGEEEFQCYAYEPKGRDA